MVDSPDERIAIIDLGTNSLRIDIYSVSPSGETKRLRQEKCMLRIGDSVFSSGLISQEAEEKITQELNRYREIVQEMEVSTTIAVGTSALREAENSTFVCERVADRTGIELRVISGQEEAQLTAQGILTNEAVPAGKFCLIDIGGGSTEISECANRHIIQTMSIPLGVLRLVRQNVELFSSYPIDISHVRSIVKSVLREHPELQAIAGPVPLIGSSGSVRSIAKIFREGGLSDGEIHRGGLEELIERMARSSKAELLKLPGLEASRIDFIVPGVVALHELMLVLKCDSIRSTEFSLRAGILAEYVAAMKA